MSTISSIATDKVADTVSDAVRSKIEDSGIVPAQTFNLIDTLLGKGNPAAAIQQGLTDQYCLQRAKEIEGANYHAVLVSLILFAALGWMGLVRMWMLVREQRIVKSRK